MKVGDLVKCNSLPGRQLGIRRHGILIAKLPKSIRVGRLTGDYFMVQWTDGARNQVREQYLKVVNKT